MKLNMILYIKNNDCYKVSTKLNGLFSSLIHIVNLADLLNFTVFHTVTFFFSFASQHLFISPISIYGICFPCQRPYEQFMPFLSSIAKTVLLHGPSSRNPTDCTGNMESNVQS